ncbi:nucleoside kinase [Blautia sp. An249]|uniref:nucleoside kinase n=1 Tax=Blautia sp. An249 TaxID=1965603 RepID=UPI000B39C932|nr:nucleoside kinase [Blautia sp. An249]OUO78641.1 nucleoside kinase [Blautia sp. An249]
MSQKMYTVTIGDEVLKYPEGTCYAEIVKKYQSTCRDPILLVTVDGKLQELHKQLKKDCTLGFITSRDKIGNEAYKRSACLILLKAIYDVAGKEELNKTVIHYSIGEAYYFTMKGSTLLNQKFLEKIRQEMQKIVEQEIPIMKRSVGTEEAIEMFLKHQMYDKARLFRYRRVSKVNIYSIGNFEDYFYGFMVNHTGYVRYFDLQLYDEGFVLLLPSREEPEKVPEFSPHKKVFQVQKESQAWGDKLDISTVGELNDRIAHQGLQEVLLIQEALQEAKISQIAEEIVRENNKKFIMIAGPSSSGKTTFSHRLSIQLAAHGIKTHPIAVDNYFVNREETPLDEFGKKNYECLEAIDIEQFNQDMLMLLKGERVELPWFNFVTGQREYKGDFLKLGSEDILVIEGIHGLNDKLSYALPRESKYKIYISALTQLNIDEHNRIPTTDGRLIRRIVRDARTRGTSAKNTIAMWPSVRRGEEQYIFPYQEDADVVFNSALIYELACLKVYAEPLLFGIEKTEPEYLEAKRLLKFFDYFLPIPSEAVPTNSLLREFIGGGCFHL